MRSQCRDRTRGDDLLRVTQSRLGALREADDFRRFHVEIDAPEARFEAIRASGRLDFAGPKEAWVPVQALLAADGAPDDAEWQGKLDAIIEKVRPHGWIRDSPTFGIKAHVVWRPA